MGGLGATVTATVFLQQGAPVTVIVAGQGGTDGGYNNEPGAGGGGLSAVYTAGPIAPTIVAGARSFLSDIGVEKLDSPTLNCKDPDSPQHDCRSALHWLLFPSQASQQLAF